MQDQMKTFRLVNMIEDAKDDFFVIKKFYLIKEKKLFIEIIFYLRKKIYYTICVI